MPSLEEIKDVILSSDPQLSKDDPAFQTAVMLLSSAFVGTDIDDLQEFTGYDRDFIEERAVRLVEQEVWVDGVVYSNWTDSEDGYVSFWLDVLVAEGFVARATEKIDDVDVEAMPE